MGVRTRNVFEKGVVLPMVAIGLLAIMGTAGLAIDLGHGYLNKSRLQNALDAAALSGARTLLASSKDTDAADVHIKDAFDAHLNGELSGLSSDNLVIQYSRLLNPFTNGTADPNFVRVRYANFTTSFTLSKLLPGIADNMNLGGSAVAGPIPIGTDDGNVCGLAPVLMCAEPGETDDNCSDDTDGDTYADCYGYALEDAGGAVCHLLKSGSPGGMGSSNFTCIEDDDGVGAGNFQLARIDENCPGGDCVREAMAGGQSACLLSGATSVLSETGVTAGPSWQGLNTRFGDYQGGMLGATEYPSDTDVRETIFHSAYEGNDRRVVTVPVVECDGTHNGLSQLPLVGTACFFLLEKLPNGGGGDITGQMIESCESAGNAGTDPGTVDPSDGPYQIILYKDPDSVET